MDDVTTSRGVRIPAGAMRWSFTRAGGPGGQCVNTSSTRVQLCVSVAELGCSEDQRAVLAAALGEEVVVTAASSRSQWQNRSAALERLAERVDAALAPRTPRRAGVVPVWARAQRVEAKRRRGAIKAQRSWRPE